MFRNLRIAIATIIFAHAMMINAGPHVKVEKWRMFEITLRGNYNGNPFTDVNLKADFVNGSDTVSVSGFYDGDGMYRIRFMPEITGRWDYHTDSNLKALDNREGAFECIPPDSVNHGPVKADSLRFHYADNSRYIPVGTTCCNIWRNIT